MANPSKHGKIEPATLSSYKGSDTVPNYAQYSIPLSDASKWKDPKSLPKLDAIVRLGGLQQEIKVTLNGVMTPAEISMGPLPQTIGTKELLAKYPFLSASPNGDQLLISPGVWDIQGDLVIPENVTLQVAPGTVLRFEPGAVLLAQGAVNLLGTANDPILLTALDSAKRVGRGGGLKCRERITLEIRQDRADAWHRTPGLDPHRWDHLFCQRYHPGSCHYRE